MEINELEIGTKIDINIVNVSGEDTSMVYTSQIEDISGEDTVVFPAPFRNNRIVFIPTETRLRITFLHSKYGLQSFTGMITNKVKSGDMLYIHTKMESDFETIQRRKHFRLSSNRLPYTLDVQYRLYKDFEESEFEEEIKYNKAAVKNISEGGLSLLIEENIPRNSLIEIEIHINKEIPLKAVCRVVRNTQVEFLKNKKYEIGIELEKLSQREQDRIVKFIFEQQRFLLKKNISKNKS